VVLPYVSHKAFFVFAKPLLVHEAWRVCHWTDGWGCMHISRGVDVQQLEEACSAELPRGWVKKGFACTPLRSAYKVPGIWPSLGSLLTKQRTLSQDYWHHVEDVAAGFLLGLGFAYLSYRMHYPPLMSSRLGEPLVEDGDVTAGAPPPLPPPPSSIDSSHSFSIQLGMYCQHHQCPLKLLTQ